MYLPSCSLWKTSILQMCRLKQRIIVVLHEGRVAAVSGKQHRERRRREIYTSGTAVCVAVCATQVGVNYRQSSGRVPLWADAACTIFPSGTGAVTNQSGDLISASGVSVKGELGKTAISNLRCHWLPLIWCRRNSACMIETLPLDHQKRKPIWRPFLMVFKRQPSGCPSCKLHFMCSHLQMLEATSWHSSCTNRLHQPFILTNVMGQMYFSVLGTDLA